MDVPSTRIYLRPIGSPLTLGMAGLFIASVVQTGLDLGWVPKQETIYIGLILATVPSTLQLVASVFSYLGRDGATGAAIGVLSTTWLALGLIHIVSGRSGANSSLGLLLLCTGAVLALSSLAVGKAKPLPGLVFATAALRFGLAGIYEFSGVSAWQTAAGIAGLVIAAMAGYCVIAFELEGQQRRPVLPTLRRGRGAVAIHDGPAAPMDGVVREAGVRQTT